MGKSRSSHYSNSKSKVYKSSFTKSKSKSKPRETPVNFKLPKFRLKTGVRASTREKQNVSLYNPAAEESRQREMSSIQRENTNARKEANKKVDDVGDLFSNMALGKGNKSKRRRRRGTRRRGTRKK